MTSREITLCNFYGAIFVFKVEIFILIYFLIKILSKEGFEDVKATALGLDIGVSG